MKPEKQASEGGFGPAYLNELLGGLIDRARGASPRSSGHPRSIEDTCRALLAAEGEVSGTVLAQTVLDQYDALDREARRAFFAFLNDELEIDHDQLAATCGLFQQGGSVADYRRLIAASAPPRLELLRRLNQAAGATFRLVKMREDLIGELAANPDLGRLDLDFLHLMRDWFNKGFLVLEEITWNTSATVLEKVVSYEAVHAIDDWDALRRRVYPEDRRCFAYFHPSMPQEPLIFVQVALVEEIPNSIQKVLAEDREICPTDRAKSAVFYSISNCQSGLRGVSFGNLLIKQVVSELHGLLPNIEQFVTLSPIPSLRRWWDEQCADPVKSELLAELASGEGFAAIAAHYLVNERTASGLPRDPVARFHLGNGAMILATHADADLSDNGLANAFGAMVNYQYDLTSIERNHELFVNHAKITSSKAVSDLAGQVAKRVTPAG